MATRAFVASTKTLNLGMDLSGQRQPRRRRSRDPLDRRVDQWIETGRQFVDGVAGTRPGKRSPVNASRLASSSMENVGRWVGDKLDWFLEEEDAWLEPWQSEEQVNSSSNKRPLEAISRRGCLPSEDFSPSNQIYEAEPEESWPDESSFRVEKWQRDSVKRVPAPRKTSMANNKTRRPLPRSSRRRD